MNSKKVIRCRTYEPDNVLRGGYFRVFPDIFREIAANRWLTCQLLKRDLLAMYKQSFMGIVWAFVIPLVSVGTFILLNRSGIFNVRDLRIPYPLFAVFGIAVWQLFAAGLTAGANALVKSGQMIMKINFSRKSLVLASYGQALISFLVQISLAFILMAVFRFAPSWYFPALPLLLLPLMLLSLGLGFIFSILNGIMRDVGNGIGILMTFFMFLTPVLYPRPSRGFLSQITRWNPLHFLVNVPRDLVLGGKSTEFSGYLWSSLFCVVVFMVCIFLFHLAETRVTERI